MTDREKMPFSLYCGHIKERRVNGIMHKDYICDVAPFPNDTQYTNTAQAVEAIRGLMIPEFTHTELPIEAKIKNTTLQATIDILEER